VVHILCPSPPDYATENELDNHLESEHNIRLPCDKRFDTPSELAQHEGYFLLRMDDRMLVEILEACHHQQSG
jgi:hypothetical protein